MAGDGRRSFLAELTVEPRRSRPGWFRAQLSDAWCFRSPQGGTLQALSLQAARALLDEPALMVRSATTVFAHTVPVGPVDIRVDVLRRGSAAAQVRVGLFAPNEPGVALETLCTFARERSGPSYTDASPPNVLPPHQAQPVEPQVPFAAGVQPEFFRNFEVRAALGARWWEEEWEPGSARYARWLRFLDHPQRDGWLDPLAYSALADTMPPAVVQHQGPGFEPFVAPSLDLTVHFLSTTQREWLLVSAWARSARAGYATAEVEIWDDTGQLLAFGNQVMMIRRVPDALRGGSSTEPLR